MELTEKIDYLDSLMTLFVKSPQIPSRLKIQIKTLRDARRHGETTDDVAIPIKVREINEEELEQYFESE
jgi:hypothetical protein